MKGKKGLIISEVKQKPSDFSCVLRFLNNFSSMVQCAKFCGAPKTFDAQKFESHTAEQKLSKGSDSN